MGKDEKAMQIGDLLAPASSDDEALAAVVGHMKADSGTIHLIGPDGMLHLAAATPGFPDIVLKTIGTIPVGKGMAGLAVERREPVNACNIQTDKSGDVRPGFCLSLRLARALRPAAARARAAGAGGSPRRRSSPPACWD
jgi:L-methionine (R)-S-oxide reductase